MSSINGSYSSLLVVEIEKPSIKVFSFEILAQNILCCDINHVLLVTLLCFINWLSARVDIFSKISSSVVPNRFIGNACNVLKNHVKTKFLKMVLAYHVSLFFVSVLDQYPCVSLNMYLNQISARHLLRGPN